MRIKTNIYRLLKSALALALCASVLLCFPTARAENAESADESTYENTYECAGVFAFSRDYGMLFSQGDTEAKLYPASVTKLVTALVALEYMDPGAVCTAGEEVLSVPKDASSAYLNPGCKATLETVLYGMLLPSGCDAAYVIAANAGKTIDPEAATAPEAAKAFVEEMNRWSERNGLTGSHWANPDGYEHDDNYTTMADLMITARLALENELIAKIAVTPEIKVKLITGEERTWKNSNWLVVPESRYYTPACVGLKTGQHDQAGGCLIAAYAVPDGDVILVGTFGSGKNSVRFDVNLAVYADACAEYDRIVKVPQEALPAGAVRGDVDGSGRVGAADYAMVKRRILYGFELTGTQLVIADMDGNRRIDGADCALIISAITPIKTR